MTGMAITLVHSARQNIKHNLIRESEKFVLEISSPAALMQLDAYFPSGMDGLVIGHCTRLSLKRFASRPFGL